MGLSVLFIKVFQDGGNCMFKPLFDFVTEFFGTITGNGVYDLFLVAIISQILYYPSCNLVGKLYFSGLIESRSAGSFFHWFFKALFFVVTVIVIGIGYKIFLFISGLFT